MLQTRKLPWYVWYQNKWVEFKTEKYYFLHCLFSCQWYKQHYGVKLSIQNTDKIRTFNLKTLDFIDVNCKPCHHPKRFYLFIKYLTHKIKLWVHPKLQIYDILWIMYDFIDDIEFYEEDQVLVYFEDEVLDIHAMLSSYTNIVEGSEVKILPMEWIWINW